MPELITPFYSPLDSTLSHKFSALNYNGFIGLLTAGMQQQQLSIDSLRNNFALPSKPVLVSPANSATSNFSNVSFVWNSASKGNTGIILYRVQVATDINFNNIVLNTKLSINDTTLPDNTLNCDTVNITYYWRVIAQNSIIHPTNNSLIFSDVFSFTDTSKCALATNNSNAIAAIHAVSFNSTSDSLFKTNVTPLTNSLAKVTQLQGVNYDWLHNNPKYQFDSAAQIGFIAQDVKKVVPQIVSKDVNGYLAVDYGRLAPVLVEAIKTLKTNNDSLQAQVNRLTSLIKSCCSNNSNARTANTNMQNVELSDAAIIVLNQNQPNPFAEQTTITYNIPQSASAAQLLFYDINGKQIQNVVITTKGKGQLNVYANDLTNGVYSYTLIVDGKIADTKKMIKQQ
jgi:hypothetical protein